MGTPELRPTPAATIWTRLVLGLAAFLTACLLAVALPVPAPHAPAPAAAEVGGEEEGEWEEEWEYGLEEEPEEDEGTADPTILPPECVLLTADPGVIAVPRRDQLRLNLRYTAEIPTRVGVQLWLKGGRGSLQLGTEHRQLARRGTIHLSRRLDPRAATKVRAARTFMVRLDVPAANRHCRPFLLFRLATRQQRGPRATWSL